MKSFLNHSTAKAIAERFGTPCYVYDETRLRDAARTALTAPAAFGHSVRYAMKACPNASILRFFHEQGILMDASSGYEAERAILAGIPPESIQITAQEFPPNLSSLLERGVGFNACSLSQIHGFARIAPEKELSIRVNPGLGSGYNNRTNTGGPASSFGIWHEHLPAVENFISRSKLRLTGMHSHIGAGTDVAVWLRCAELTLAVVERFPSVTRVSLGGGFKTARVDGETSTDLHAALFAVAEKFKEFESKTGRGLRLEIEPGTYLVANAGTIVSRICDVVDTGEDGYRFIKIDSGMSEILRPSLYGAQHPVWIAPAEDSPEGAAKDYVIVGHCCESGDILTPAQGDPEGLLPRTFTQVPKIGDLLLIGGAGAYCSSMSAKNYNSFPEAPEVLQDSQGSVKLIRQRQTLEQILCNEIV